MSFIVYKITNKVNGKVYIGQTNEPLKVRFQRHMGYQKDGHDTYFYRAVRKYGKENFEIEQIDSAESQEELDIKEMEWILKLRALEEEFGYNTKASIGKCGGDTLSNHPNKEEISKKIALGKVGGKNPNSTAVIAINLHTGERIKYSSVKECQLAFGIPRHDIIIRRCTGKIKKPLNLKWTFEYAEGVSTIETTRPK